MLIELNRFLTGDEIEELYQMPPDVLPTVMASLPVAHRGEDGQPYFVESDVDRAVDAFASRRAAPDLRSRPERKAGPKEHDRRHRPGRQRPEGQGKTWKEILAACKSRFPGRVKSGEQVRTIWRRRFGGKK